MNSNILRLKTDETADIPDNVARRMIAAGTAAPAQTDTEKAQAVDADLSDLVPVEQDPAPSDDNEDDDILG